MNDSTIIETYLYRNYLIYIFLCSFRLGKMYRYVLDKYDPESMTNFVNGFYKNYPAEAIPLPKSPFDDLVQLCVDYMKEYPLLVGASLAAPVLLLLAFLWLMKPEEEKRRKSKKEKKDKNRDSNGTAKDSKSPKATPKSSKSKSTDKKEEGKEKEKKKTESSKNH